MKQCTTYNNKLGSPGSKDKGEMQQDRNGISEKLQEQLALEFKSMGFLDRSNPIRKFMVKLVQFKTFDRFILFLILLNCSILAMQTPIKVRPP